MTINAAMFDTKPYDRESFEKYNGKNGINIRYYDTRLTEDTVSLAENSDVVIVFVNDAVNAAVIEKLYASGVRLIALRCAGFNNVDVHAAFGKIHVVRVSAYSPYAVAEHAMALLLTSIRRTHKAYNRTKDFNFSLNGLTGFDLYGKTMGIVGTGKIGRVFLNICRGFGMKILAYDPFPDKTLPAEYTDLDTLFRKSDILSLHCPLTPENHHMINAESLETMKDGVVIINTSRGSLIHAESLVEAIKSKKVGAACLDVYEEESDIFFEDKSGHIMRDEILARLLSMPNVLITSHQAFLTKEALDNIAETTIANMRSFFEEDVLDNEICYRCGRVEQCRKERKEKCF